MPDAKLKKAKNDIRSEKCLSEKKWLEVLNKIPKSLRTGIVMGHEHPEYTERVLESAQKAGVDAVRVQTPTLNDFCIEVLKTKKFIGMDSGTTHLAYEVIRAAQPVGRKILMREVFNNSIVDVNYFGVRGLGDQGKILSYKANPKQTVSKDLDGIKAEEVADFILS